MCNSASKIYSKETMTMPADSALTLFIAIIIFLLYITFFVIKKGLIKSKITTKNI